MKVRTQKLSEMYLPIFVMCLTIDFKIFKMFYDYIPTDVRRETAWRDTRNESKITQL